MGAYWITGSFVDYSWSDGIRRVQDQYTASNGYQEGYSGGPNCVDFRFFGDKSKLSAEAFKKFLNTRFDDLFKGAGEVVMRGIKEYRILKTKYTVKDKVPEHIRVAMRRSDIGYQNPGPNFLVEYDDDGLFLKLRGIGKVADLKRIAHKMMRENYYKNDMYIVPKSSNGRMVVCGCDAKAVKSTKRVSNDTTLVAPVKYFVYYGWAPN